MGFITKKSYREMIATEKNMEASVNDTLQYYCNSEINRFISSSIYSTLNELVKSHEFNLDLCYGKAKDKNDKNFYLSLSVCDKNGRLVEVFDGSCLTTATMLILVDKKERYKFFSWQDENFIKDLNWIMDQLNIFE